MAKLELRAKVATLTNAETPDRAPDSVAVFECLFRDHHSRVVRFFVKRGFSTEESFDLAQESFLRVFRAIGRLTEVAEPRSWLFSIVSHVWHNELRRRDALKRRGQEVAIGSPDGPSELGSQPSPRVPELVDALLQKERLANAARLIEDLPPRMRQTLLLHAAQDLSYAEVARIMGSSVETVRAQIHDARRRLRSRLSPLIAARGGAAVGDPTLGGRSPSSSEGPHG